MLNYEGLTPEIIESHTLIVNATPQGMFPKKSGYPSIPYQLLSSHHFLYDLVYNPEDTQFLKKGKLQGSRTQSGMMMLELQAEESLRIFIETMG